ncbi:MAG: aspartate kinase [Bacteroidales bacterium]|nr:aspartate kinase [Bacteroidales bacterium]
MKVYKFGGASVKDVKGIENIAKILQDHSDDKMLVIVSAMGKTTNALENLLDLSLSKKDWEVAFHSIQSFHIDICHELFPQDHAVFGDLKLLFDELAALLRKVVSAKYDYYYDQIVSLGELFSTTIVAKYLSDQKMDCELGDARQLILTDDSFRSAKVDIDATVRAMQEGMKSISGIWLVQGFIGYNKNGDTTTLGREGSDYSAALFANALDVDEVTIWKDVDGVYNADPKIFSQVSLIQELSYKDAVELAFYGASIIHPKTIQPLKKKMIKLKVRSFYHRNNTGTSIHELGINKKQETTIIVKKNQVLLSLTPRDFSFMDVENIGLAFQILSKHHQQINLIQNSAISFSICLDDHPSQFTDTVHDLQKIFELRYNRNQVLVTIRHYQPEVIEKIYAQLEFKIEQRNRSTYQILVSEQEFESKLIKMLNE